MFTVLHVYCLLDGDLLSTTNICTIALEVGIHVLAIYNNV